MSLLGVLLFCAVTTTIGPVGQDASAPQDAIAAALEAGDLDGAQAKAEQWVASDPNAPYAHLFLGFCFEQRGDGKADREFDRALELGAADADLTLQIADVYATRFADVIASGVTDGAPAERARAEELYAKVADLQGNSMVALPRIAWLKRTGGDIAGAKAVLFAAIALDPLADGPHYDLWSLIGSGVEYDELASFYDGLSAGNYAPAARARCRSFQGQVFANKALAHRAAAATAAEASDSLAHAAALEAARNAYVASIPCFDRAIAADPAGADAPRREQIRSLVGIVEVLGERSDFGAARLAAADARDAIDPLLRASPDDPQLQLDADSVSYALFVAAGGEANRDANYATRMGEIYDHWAWATSIVTHRADWWNNLGFFAREAAKYEESYAAYRKCIELAPDNVRYVNDTALILLYHLHRDLDEAERLLVRAVQLGAAQYPNVKDDPAAEADMRSAWGDAMLNHGKLLTERDRFDDADSAFARLAAFDPERPDLARERETLAMKRRLRAALDAGDIAAVTTLLEADLAEECAVRQKFVVGRDDEARVVQLARWAAAQRAGDPALDAFIARSIEAIHAADAERVAGSSESESP
ncbi:MAG: hypothetical protein IPH13_09625 [Planctomycetes bacterium]|nr:hypothetical protein [Planctomycetota bacterium]